MIGEKLNQYVIKSVLGEGGMAYVYLAHDENFKFDVAIKVLKKEFVYNQNIRKRFVAEARSMRKMTHPNIIKVTDLIDAGDIVAFVMEYIDGETLKEYVIEKDGLSDDEIKHLLPQMLDGLAYVHEQGLIHRDIKPSNFLLTNDGVVKLTDFGIAKSTDPDASEYTMTGTTQQMGTPLYMSPEQVVSSKELTKHTDIYSLGVVLWFMITAKKPYDETTPSFFQLQTLIVQQALPKTDTTWDSIISTATGKKVDTRYKDAETFKRFVLSYSPRRVDTKVRRVLPLTFIGILVAILLSIIYFVSPSKGIDRTPRSSDEGLNKDSVQYSTIKGKEAKFTDTISPFAKEEAENIERSVVSKDTSSVDFTNTGKNRGRLRVGDFYGGGIIIQINYNGTHGIIASERDIGSMPCFKAKSAAEKYVDYGFEDWKLPNREELTLIYSSRSNFSSWRYSSYVNSNFINAENGLAEILDFSSGKLSQHGGKYDAFVWPARNF